MHNVFQTTLTKSVSFSGVGLHSGKNSKVKILPGNEDKGIVFKRIDLKENNLIKANYANVSSAKLCTTLENSHGVKVSTVEHLLAAVYIAGIDNAIIEIDNEEVPIMDGSASEFLKLLKKAELVNQRKKRKYLKIIKKIEFKDNTRQISIEPNNSSLEVNFHLNYKNRIIGKQQNTVNLHNDKLEDVFNSRTFCLFEDIEKIKKMGLAKGGSLDNAIVVDDEKILNDNGLRNDKEFVNHKILDLVGDFLLSGYRVLGKVTCHQGGHELTNLFLRKMFRENLSFKVIELEDFFASNQVKLKQSHKLAANA